MDQDQQLAERRAEALRRAEGLIREICRSWEFMTTNEFNPLTVALRLCDASATLGLSYEDFRHLQAQMESALSNVVEEYHTGFTESIMVYSDLREQLFDAQDAVHALKRNLLRTRESLLQKRTAIGSLLVKSNRFGEMLRIIDRIEEIKKLPRELVAFKREKKFLTAASGLLTALQTLSAPEMRKIAAFGELRAQLERERTMLVDVLIDELHNHVYLKSPYCQRKPSLCSLFNNNNSNNASSTSSVSGQTVGITGGLVPGSKKTGDGAGDGGDAAAAAASGLDKSPEADSFGYVEVIIVSLEMLGSLGDALNAVSERIPVELHQFVEGIISEVEERHKASNDTNDVLALIDQQMLGSTSANSSTNSSGKSDNNTEVVEELIGLLFARLESVLEYHHHVLNIVDGIAQRDSVANSLKNNTNIANQNAIRRSIIGNQTSAVIAKYRYTMKQVWKYVQAEVKAAIYDYLADPTNSTAAASLLTVLNQTARHGRPKRDKSKNLFSFGQSTLRGSNDPLFKPVDDLRSALVTPRLAASLSSTSTDSTDAKKRSTITASGHHRSDSSSASEQRNSSYGTPTITLDDYSEKHAVIGHRKLAKPNIEHVSIVLPMALRMLDDVSTNNVLSDSEVNEFRLFLREFFISQFLPLAESHAFYQLDKHLNSSDAFHPDSEVYHCDRPVFKGAVAIMPILHKLGSMLESVPFFNHEYLELIEKLMRRYFEKCHLIFTDMVSPRGGSSLSIESSSDAASTVSSASQNSREYISTNWAKDEDLLQLLDMKLRLVGTKGGDTFDRSSSKEIELEHDLKGEKSFHHGDLMFDPKRLSFLAHCHNSAEWLVEKLTSLSKWKRDQQQSNISVTVTTAATAAIASSSAVSTPSTYAAAAAINPQTAAQLDARRRMEAVRSRLYDLTEKFRSLATTSIIILRIEFRVHAMYYIDLATREGSYLLREEATEPDPYVQNLNADLVSCEAGLSEFLPPSKMNFVLGGISTLVGNLLVANTRYIRRLNAAGNRKMIRNVLALQQNLTNLGLPGETGLARARQYFELFDLGVSGIIAKIGEDGGPPMFSLNEYQRLMGYIYENEDAENGELEISARASNLVNSERYQMYVQHEVQLRDAFNNASRHR
ncbi:hypothetical protein GQ42DRAFT_162029 [Ramicandelaber brevisporus]|nr:hypothetical protein GQ42DRAFT_162029 [Ramicandelaber brevisporus]